MGEIKNEIPTLYNNLINKLNTSKFYQVDLHIHTPGSKGDYRVNGKYYEQVTEEELINLIYSKEVYTPEQLKVIDFTELEKDDLVSSLIIHEAFHIKCLNLIVITDHNTVDWYPKIIKAIKSYFSSHDTKGRKFTVLPGVEITCFGGRHVIAILDNNKYLRQWENLKFLLNGIDDSTEKSRKTFTDKSEIDVVNAITQVGGIAYLPHIDTYNETIDNILDSVSGTSKIQLLRNKNLSAVGFSNYDLHFKLKANLEDLQNDYYRPHPLAYLIDSDAHDIDEIGRKKMFFKMEKPNFYSLKFALEDPSTRIRHTISKEIDNPFIKGCLTRGGFLAKSDIEWTYYPFGSDLNCIIGGRGTGKSTLLNIIQSSFTGRTPDHKFRLFISRFSDILIYFYFNKRNYCIFLKPQIYRDSYTDEEINKHGECYKQKTNNIENWISLFEINEKKKECRKLNNNKKYEILNEFYFDFFGQTEISKIGNEERYLEVFLDKLILKTNKRNNYKNLIEEEERTVKNIKNQLQNNINLNEKLKKLIFNLEDLENEIHNTRLEIMKELNNTLENKIIFQFDNNKINEDLFLLLINQLEFIKKKNEFNYNKIERIISYICEKYKARKLLVLFSEKPELLFEELKNNKIFENINSAEVENINIEDKEIFNLLQDKYLNNIERILLMNSNNAINILINVNSYDANLKRNINPKFLPIETLSFGQQAVAILSIIMEGFSNEIETPLIIDQPEDQLDNKYIFQHLIENIRKLKNKRQLILVTHNANIPVSGDAETIICMESNNSNGWCKITGSIDNPKIQKQIIDLLEGGKESLKMRLKKYSIELLNK